MNAQTEKTEFSHRFNSFAGKAGVLTGILLFPAIFQKLFAIGMLRSNEWNGLLIVSILLLVWSVLLILKKKTGKTGFSLLLFTFLFLIFVELSARFSIKVFCGDETKNKLKEQCNWTYPENTAYTGHPFLQFIGKPTVALKGNQALGNLSPFNNFGFVGADFDYYKPADVIRIACIGESTTADGYPAFLQTYLNNNRRNKTFHFEVMNFGHAYWTTNHSVVNFILNVVDFNPDFVVIHHGWNEAKVRNTTPEEFRGDYFHAFKVFGYPVVYDRYPIRLSVLYRLFKFRYDKAPSWASLGGSIQYDRKELEPYYANLAELKPYRRNLENIIDIALTRGIKVVLTTLPHSTDENIPLYYGYKSIDQCNAINRELNNRFIGKILFVDLDSMISGKHNEVFKDLGHITDEGRTMKSEAIGKSILGEVGDNPVNNFFLKNQTFDKTVAVAFYLSHIRSNPEWQKDIQKKAQERKVSMDEMIRLDAEWLAQQDSIRFFSKSE